MIEHVSPNELVAWEMNPRKRVDPKSLQPLVDSMRAVGWFGAILVRPDAEEPDRYQVVSGERRWRASMTVGLPRIAVEVRELSDREAIELAVIENRDREDLDIIEEAGGYKAMVDLGWSVKEIAERSGQTEAKIYEMLDIVNFPEMVKEELRGGKLTATTARLLARIENVKKLEEAIDRVARPRLQDHPLSQNVAVPMIQREYLDPQKRAKEWEKASKKLPKEFGKNVRAADAEEALDITAWNSDYSKCDEKPAHWEMAVHAREWNPDMVPTWGDLAKKHGAERVAVPDVNGKPVLYVRTPPLIDAELAVYANDAKNCLFPMPGSGRHEQAMDAEREDASRVAKDAETRNEGKRLRREVIRELWNGYGNGGDAWKMGRPSEVFGGVMKWMVRHEIYEGLETVPEELGIDLVALGDGDAAAGLEKWLSGDGTIMMGAFLWMAYGVMNQWESGDGFVERIKELHGIIHGEA